MCINAFKAECAKANHQTDVVGEGRFLLPSIGQCVVEQIPSGEGFGWRVSLIVNLDLYLGSMIGMEGDVFECDSLNGATLKMNLKRVVQFQLIELPDFLEPSALGLSFYDSAIVEALLPAVPCAQAMLVRWIRLLGPGVESKNHLHPRRIRASVFLPRHRYPAT